MQNELLLTTRGDLDVWADLSRTKNTLASADNEEPL